MKAFNDGTRLRWTTLARGSDVRWIKIGDRYINAAEIEEVCDTPTEVRIRFTSGTTTALYHHEAQQLLDWLAGQETDGAQRPDSDE